MGVKGSTNPFTNVLGLGIHATWKVYRYPFHEVGTDTVDKMQEGYLVKFNAAGDKVEPALAADDAALGGIIVGLPGVEETVGQETVAVAVQGEFNFNQVHYADAHEAAEADPPTAPDPLSAAAVARLRELGIFLDPAIPAGGLQP